MTYRKSSQSVCIIWLISLCALPVGLSLAQVAVIGIEGTADSTDASKPMPLVTANDEVAETLAKAEKMLTEEGKQDRAIRIIQDLVNASTETSFVSGKDGRLFISVARRANELLDGMDDRGKEMYRKLYDPQARAIYDKAIEENDAAALYKVATNYLHTTYGPKALETLGTFSFDEGRFALAALYWRKRLAAGPYDGLLLTRLAVACHYAGWDPDSQAYALELTEKYPEGTAEIGGRQQKLVDFVSAVRAAPPIVVTKEGPVDGWPGLGGIPNGIGTMADCDVVLIPRWQWGQDGQDIEDRSLIQHLFGLSEAIEKFTFMQTRYHGQPPSRLQVSMRGGQVQLKGTSLGASGNKIIMPATLHPVAVGDKLIFRGEDRVRAIDGLTGNVEWESVPLKMTRKEGSNYQGWWGWASMLQFGDEGRYSLSVGGGKIFTVYGFLPALAESMRRMPNNGEQAVDNSELAALSTGGRLLWAVGGEKENDEFLKACRFFTAPTYASGKLYAIVMYHDTYHLVCLDANDGSLMWSSCVSQAPEFGNENGLDYSSLLDRPSPVAVADGKCYALTNAGVIAAFDAEAGRPYWAYQYDSEVAAMTDRSVSGVFSSMSGVLRPANPIIVINGQVVCLPADSSQLLVLSGEDGNLLWNTSSSSQYHLTVIDDNRVLLSSPALDVVDINARKTVFSAAPRPEITGRPAVTGGRVLASSEGLIHVLNLDDMKLDTMSLARSDGLLGNLISAGGKLYAANSAGVCAYFSYEMARTELTRRAEHEQGEELAETLFERGRVAFDSLRFSEAIDDFNESLKAAESTEGQRAFNARLQPWLYRSCIAMANIARQDEQMLEWFSKAEPHAVSPQDKAHLALRVVKYYAKKENWPVAAKLAQKLSEEYPEQKITDVKIGPEADSSVRTEEIDPMVLCKTLAQGMIADWIRKYGREAVYAEIDAAAGEEFNAASQAADADRLVGVASRWPNSIWADASQLAAAELYCGKLAAPDVTNRDELIATARSYLAAVANKSDSPLRIKAEALLAVLWSRSGYPVIASLICSELKADPKFNGAETIQFADINGSLNEIIQQVEASGATAAVASKLDVGITMPIREIFRMDEEPTQILRDQQYRPVRLGEMLLALKGPRAVMIETTDSSSDSAVRWAGLMTEINTENIMRDAVYPPGMRIVAGLSSDQKRLVIADRTQVAGFDVASAKVIYNKKLSEYGIDAVYNIAVGSDVLVTTTTTGQVTCINMSDGAIRWRGTTVGKNRFVISPPQIGGGMVLTCNDNFKTITCFDLNTGRLLADPWKAEIFAQGFVTDSGLLVMMIDGELTVRDKSSLDKPMWSRKYDGRKRPVILAVSNDKIAVSPEPGAGDVEILAIAGDGSKPLAAVNADEGRKGVIPVDAQFSGDSLYVVGTAEPQMANGRKQLYGSMSMAKGLVIQKFDIAQSRLAWSRMIEDERSESMVLPLEIGRNHVAVTLKPGDSTLVNKVYLLEIDKGEPVEEIELARALEQKKLDPMRMIIGPPVIMSGRLVVETAEGIRVYGNQ